MARDELLYTNRNSESGAFAAALAAHRSRLDSDASHASQGQNVLVFHGMGGLGKTALSQRLLEWAEGRLPAIEGWGPRPETHVDATVRIDLKGGDGKIHPAELLYTLRRQLGAYRSSWPCFDIAFATYWASIKPGVDFPVGTEEDRDFKNAVLATAGAVFEDSLPKEFDWPSTAAQVAGLLFGSLWSLFDRRIRRLPGVPDDYEDLLKDLRVLATPDDPRPDLVERMVGLLLSDLAAADESPLIVVFVDTFEKLDLDARREGEELLNRIAWSLHSMLFVVTGRSALRWARLDGHTLPHRGGKVWPLLTVPPGSIEPRQHSVGSLTETDSCAVLEHASRRHGLGLDDTLIRRIAHSSGGNPKYLEIAIEVAITYVRNDEAVTEAAVTGSLESMVAMLFDGIPADEQRVLRIVALLGSTDAKLAAAVVGYDHGAAQRALDRSLVSPSESDSTQFTMHDSVREILLDAGYSVANGWADDDWISAGTRALEHVHIRWQQSIEAYRDAVRDEDYSAIASTADRALRDYAIAMRIVCAVPAGIGAPKFAVYGDWVTEALVFGPSIAGLSAHVPARSRTDLGAAILLFLAGKDITLPREEREASLQRLAGVPLPIARVGSRHLAYLYAGGSEWDRSLAQWDRLISERPNAPKFSQRQRAYTLISARRYRQVHDEPSWSDDEIRPRLRGRIRYDHGKPKELLEWSASRLTSGVDSMNLKDHLELAGAHLARQALIRGASAGEVDAMRLRAEAAGHEAALQDALLAGILIGHGSTSTALDLIERTDRDRSARRIAGRTALARTALAYLDDDQAAMENLWREASESAEPRTRLWIPVECLLHSRGLVLPDVPAEWIGPYEDVVTRWVALWENWRLRRLTET
ncbi:hypothetical protein [Microbacterium sp. SS28]|uniref:hypothetical protein n=1 Tax=Microbacterium sp. SS28 TaxID=2919948 RepID=UPI001FAB1D0C|nr:hypothetical protein [Microbacterium sp. SS28]